jgi:hypothetical protein
VSLNEDNKSKEKKGPSRASRYKKTRRECAKPVLRPQAKAAGGRIRNTWAEVIFWVPVNAEAGVKVMAVALAEDAPELPEASRRT